MQFGLPDRVIAATEDTCDMAAVVDQAATEAGRRGLPLHLYAQASRPATDAIRRARSTWPGLDVTASPAGVDLAATLVSESRAARVVVVGRPLAGAPAVSVHGSVAAHAHCPVLVVPPDVGAVLDGPVLVGLDISATDDPALAFAFEEADLRHKSLLAVHVWTGVPRNDLNPVDPYVYDLSAARLTVDRLLAEAVAGWADKYPDVSVEKRPHRDPDPARALLAEGRRASLVVLGANRHGPRSSRLLGRVARTLIDRAGSPIAVVTGHR